MKYIIADLHLDHALSNPEKFHRLFAGRPTDFPEMIIDLINSKVKKSDTLLLVGDFCFKKPGHYRTKIKCKDVWLIRGNHDPVSKSKQVFGGHFVETMDTHILKHRCWISHYPHAYWPASHKGSFCLYGHEHDNREETLDNIWPERRSTDTSPETYKRLYGEWGIFSEEQIFDFLIHRKGHDEVAFYKHRRGEKLVKEEIKPFYRRLQIDLPVEYECEIVGDLVASSDSKELSEYMIEIQATNDIFISAGWYPESHPEGLYRIEMTKDLELLRKCFYTKNVEVAKRIIEQWTKEVCPRSIIL